MKLNLGAARDDIARAREAAILEAWPPSKQMEALTEAAMGRPAKLEQLQAFILTVKERFPYDVVSQ